jgi:hypothetical protein
MHGGVQLRRNNRDAAYGRRLRVNVPSALPLSYTPNQNALVAHLGWWVVAGFEPTTSRATPTLLGGLGLENATPVPNYC